MFPTIFRTFTPPKFQIVTSNWIYDKTPYVQLLIFLKPWQFYIIPEGVDDDIFQLCLDRASKGQKNLLMSNILS